MVGVLSGSHVGEVRYAAMYNAGFAGVLAVGKYDGAEKDCVAMVTRCYLSPCDEGLGS